VRSAVVAVRRPHTNFGRDPPSPLLYAAVGDIDALGPQLLTLDADGVLSAGARHAVVDLEPSAPRPSTSVSIRAAAFQRATDDPAVVIAQPIDDDEDPPNRYTILTVLQRCSELAG